MPRLSIGRTVRLVLVGLAVALAVLAALGVADLAASRQRYEDRLSQADALDAGGARTLAAGALLERALLDPAASRVERARAAAALRDAAGPALRLAAADPPSAALVLRETAALSRAAAEDRGRRGSGTRRSTQRSAANRSRAAAAAVALAARQDVRRTAARHSAHDDARRAMILIIGAGALALLAVLALVAGLVSVLRGPLEELVEATDRLAAGAHATRVRVRGPTELRALAVSFNTMAEDLEVAWRRVDDHRARLADVIGSLGDGLLICDADGVVSEANPRAQVLVPEIQPGARLDAPDSPLPALEHALADEVIVELRERSLAVTAARLGDHAVGGMVVAVRDVTERTRLERAKSEFVATASHELRSPLTSIKGFVELLGRESGFTARQVEWLRIVALSTERLNDLVGDLLDVARIEAGRLEVRPRACDIGELIREVAELMTPRLGDKGQQLRVRADPVAPEAWADPGRMRQVISNLVTNAHLYTDRDGVITVELTADAEGVRLDVSDTGRGMTPEELDRVFDRFTRVGDGSGPSGTGLGLSIVRSLVELQDGEVTVASEPGRGTTFSVRLPAAPRAPAEAHGAVLRGRRVLVVDDEPAIAALVAAQLAAHGMEPITVHDGAEALARLHSEHFDAITLDVLMPGLSGFEVLRRIRRDPALAETPVVVVSVFSTHEALAGEWTVAKPIDAGELVGALGAALVARRTRVLIVSREATRAGLAATLDGLGVEHAWVGSALAARSACAERRFEVALLDAGLDNPQAALGALDLRGRRLGQTVIVVSTGDDSPGLARLDASPVALEDAAAAVLAALGR